MQIKNDNKHIKSHPLSRADLVIKTASNDEELNYPYKGMSVVNSHSIAVISLHRLHF